MNFATVQGERTTEREREREREENNYSSKKYNNRERQRRQWQKWMEGDEERDVENEDID